MQLEDAMRLFAALCAATLWLGPRATAQTNHPPATPGVTEPAYEGRVVNAGDVHMESTAFSDPDPGDAHACSDWEIWLVNPPERAWVTSCIGGVERVHTHLGDGVFENSHAGRRELFYDTEYRLRVRHKDTSGASNEWSDWAERGFRTGPRTQVSPLEMSEIVDSPTPQWVATAGGFILLPVSDSPPFLRVQTADNQPLLEIRALNGGTNEILNPPPLASHTPTMVRVSAGDLTAPLSIPESELRYTTDDSRARVIYLPALNVPPGADAYFWVSESGATYVAQAGQMTPDFTTLARGATTPWTVAPGFKAEIVASGFSLPVNIAFVPNPLAGQDAPIYYVTELYGSIKVVYRDGSVHTFASNLLNFPPTGNFPGSGEQGLTGVAVEPSTGTVYATLLYDWTGSSGFHFPRVVKFQSEDGGRTASEVVTVLDMPNEMQGQSHQISTISFGPDSKVYVHVGDGFDATRGQDLSSFRGKILRLNPDGSAPEDNPFYDAADGITARDYVYAYGFRNPFGGGWRFSDNRLFEVENGPGVDRFALVNRGQNYLYDGSDESMSSGAILNWSPPTAPVNIRFIEPMTFGGSGFPPASMGHAYITLSGPTWEAGPAPIAKRIAEFELDDNGAVVRELAPIVNYNGSGRSTVCALAAGPDGLYFSDLYSETSDNPAEAGANILRVKYTGEVKFFANVKRGPGPLTVKFTDQSTALAPTSWFWDFGDGTTSTSPNPTHTYFQNGTFTVRLSVEGSGGLIVGQRTNYIVVSPEVRVAFVGGNAVPAGGDDLVIQRLRDAGMTVDYFDDDNPDRPHGVDVAAGRNLIIVSSTIRGGPVLVEFRDLDTPVLFWQQTLLFPQFEGLSTSAARVAGVSVVTITNNHHPITQGMSIGDIPVTTAPWPANFAAGTLPPGVQTLATRVNTPDQYAIAVADAGSELLDGRHAAARRVFFFADDLTWAFITPHAETLFERSVAWAIHAGPPVIFTQPDQHVVTQGDRVTLTCEAGGLAPQTYQWRRNASIIAGATGTSITFESIQPGDAGTFDVVVSNWYGSSVSDPALVEVSCLADFNADGAINSSDLFAYIECFFDPSCIKADLNHSGSVASDDFFLFVGAFFSTCP